eukprot:TRINITY_DN5461_c0_g1_i14.p1 TRINITY_DN5461_c0_g1~~TRINITY_DN5461_c0_g1_i14.p1  ORF type:complete len:507 (-),score=87.66 TRINITY_DN5461_c0_g1_i14:342-1862(-)
MENSVRAISIAALAAAGVGGSIMVWRVFNSQKKSKAYNDILEEYKPYFELSIDKMEQLQMDFIQQIKEGLTSKGSSLLMLPTFITEMPSGKESGEYYALDLGGTNFRVLYVKLSDKDGEVEEEILGEYSMDKKVMVMHVDDLFGFLAEKVLEFLKKNGKYKQDKSYTFGFCFSFPMDQTSVNSAKLIQWTKGYNAEGGVGADPVQLLSKALNKVGVQNTVGSLMNDTVGVLAAEKYQDPDAKVGLIVGTGCNACYVEKVGNVLKWNSEGIESNTDTIIDVEWGGYDTPLLPCCEEDLQLDKESVIPGAMRFEKLLAGMYMGEIARRIIVRLIKEAGLFGGRVLKPFEQQYSLTTPQLSMIDSDTTPDLSITAKVIGRYAGLTPFFIATEDRKIVKQVCNMIALRSAKLVAMAISALFNQMGLSYKDGVENPRTVVAVDGGMYEKWERYQKLLKNELFNLFGPKMCGSTKCVDLEVCEFTLHNDGSSMGAAVVAAAQYRGKQNQNEI